MDRDEFAEKGVLVAELLNGGLAPGADLLEGEVPLEEGLPLGAGSA
jgi:hypothetical protein